MRIESNGYTVKDIFGLGDGSIKISARGEVFTFDTETIEVVNGEFSSADFGLLLEAMTAAKRKADQIQEMLKRDDPGAPSIPTFPATPPTGYVGKPIDSAVMLDVLNGWINSAKENHEASEHRPERIPCWNRFTAADIRYMIADAERETAERSARKATA